MTTAFQPNAFQGYAFQVDPVTGSIYVIDDNDTATLIGNVTGGGETVDMHDGGTRRRKHLEAVNRKLAKAQEDAQKAFSDSNRQRRLALRKNIAPETLVKVKILEVESSQDEVNTTPDLDKVKQTIANLERERLQLLRKIALEEGQRQFDAYMAKLRADYEQNLEDEEALLMLL